MNFTGRAWLYVVLILGAMFALLWRPMHEDSATIDEPVFVGAGYSYWHGQGYYFNAEHPPLAQLWTTLPLLWLPVKIPPNHEHYWERPSPLPTLTTWTASVRPREEFGAGPPPFYLYPHLEAGYFGQALVYRGVNNADQMLFWCRVMQALLTLATGVVIFCWARSLSNATGGILALLTWAFNPLALAYGHLVGTDVPMALTGLLAIWMWCRFLESPRLSRSLLAGTCLGLALLTKYTAILLGPVFLVLAGIQLLRQRSAWRAVIGLGAFSAFVAYLVIVAFYLPHLSPPPPIDPAMAQQLGVPLWFQTWRVLLVPADYFRGLALMLVHAQGGHDSYLLGKWSPTGWWYYYPLAILWKTPTAFLLLIVLTIVEALNYRHDRSFSGWLPLMTGGVFLALAMFNRANIGIRHILLLFPLLSVFVGAQLQKFRLSGWILCGVMLLVVIWAQPRYIGYFNELAGGSANGQHYLIDSNLDWGQDVKRLQDYVKEKGIQQLYGSYFGPGGALTYYHVPFVGQTAGELAARHDVWVAVSVNWLMRPEYAWLRENHQPVDRVGDTIFIYQLP